MGTFRHLQFAFYVIILLLLVQESEQAACRDVASVDFINRDMTCAQAVQFAGPNIVCASSGSKGPCCRTCKRLKRRNRGNRACPYGDLGAYLFLGETTPTKCDKPYMKQYCSNPAFYSACCNFCSASSSSSITTRSDVPACKDVALFKLNNQSMTCAQAVQTYGPNVVCTTSALKDICCNTCKQLKQENQGNTACPYGDLGFYLYKGDTTPKKCDENSFNKYMCRFNYFRSVCCNFCSTRSK